MGRLGQLGLLLWKNLKLRQRRPVLTIAQIVWPLLIFIVIVILRSSFPPQGIQECRYNARAMPSAGLLPFMQSMVCDLESTCVNTSLASNDVPSLADAQIGQVVQDLGPVLQNKTLLNYVKDLPKTLEPIRELSMVVEGTVKNLTDKQPRVADLFQAGTKDALVESGLPRDATNAIFDATVNTLGILNLFGSLGPDLLCNATALQNSLKFSAGTDVTAVSAALCQLTEEEKLAILVRVPNQLNISYIQNEFQQFSDAVEPFTLEVFLNDIRELQSAFEGMDGFDTLVDALPQLLRLFEKGPLIEELFAELQKDGRDRLIDQLVEIFENFEGSYLERGYAWSYYKRFFINVRKVAKGKEPIFQSYYDINVPLVKGVENVSALSEQLLTRDLNLTEEDVDWLLSGRVFIYGVSRLNYSLEYPMYYYYDYYYCHYYRQYDYDNQNPGSDIGYILDTLNCHANITGVLVTLKGHLDLDLLSSELDRLAAKQQNTTVDYRAVVYETINLVDRVKQMDYRVLVNIAENIGKVQGGWFGAVGPWLGVFFNTTELILAGDRTEAVGDYGVPYWLDGLFRMAQTQLLQYAVYPYIHKQLVIQYLVLQLEIDIVKTFAGVSCPKDWYSHGPSCYQYQHTMTTYEEAGAICRDAHRLGHSVTVNDDREQEFLLTIGENTPVWLGADINASEWIDEEPLLYSYWDGKRSQAADRCLAANFGSTGLWYITSCSGIADSLCELPKEHALISLINNSPHEDLDDLIMKIGPNATRVFLQAILNPAFLVMILSQGEVMMPSTLCDESFLDAIGPYLSGDLLREVCAFDPQAFWKAQVEYWSFSDLEKQFSEIADVSYTYPSEALFSNYQYVDISAVVAKQLELQAVIEESLQVPLNFDFLDQGGLTEFTPEAWAAVFEEAFNYFNQQMFQEILAQASMDNQTTHYAYEPTEVLSFVQEQLAYQYVALLGVDAGNFIFRTVEELSYGEVSVSQPETQKFLMGIKMLLVQSSEIQLALFNAVTDEEKAQVLLSTTESFCDPYLREYILQNLSGESQAVFDDYLCDVDYTLLSQEVSLLLGVPEIEHLINSYILSSSYSELLDMPDPMDIRESWQELFTHLMNIRGTLLAYDSTYELLGIDMGTAVTEMMNIQSLIKGFNSIYPILANESFFQDIVRNVLISDAIIVTLSESLLRHTGDSFTFPDDIGSMTNGDEIKKLIPLTYRLPDILRVVLELSNDPQKIQELVTSPGIMADLCSEAGLDFLDSSFASNADLAGLHTEICRIDIIALIREASSLPFVEKLMSELPPLLDVYRPLPELNLTAVMAHMDQLSASFAIFLSDPLRVDYNYWWHGQTLPELEQVLDDYNMYSNDPARVLEYLQSVLESLEMDPRFRGILDIATASLGYVNEILVMLPGEDVTLGDILPAYIADYASKAVDYGIDINALLLGTIVSPEAMNLIVGGGDFFALVCGDISQLEALITVPPEVNLTAAQGLLCSLDTTAISEEVTSEVHSILAMAQNGTGSEGFMAVINDLTRSFDALSVRPPSFPQFDMEWLESTSQKLNAVVANLESMSTTVPYTMDLEVLFNMITQSMKNSTEYNDYLTSLRLQDYFTSLILEETYQLVGKNITYAALSKELTGLPTIREVLALREVIPEMVNVLIALSTNQEKFSRFLSSPTPVMTACREGTFTYYFGLPFNSTTDVEALEAKLCGLNETMLLVELDALLGIGKIQQEISQILASDPSLPPFNFTAAFTREAQLQTVLAELFTSPPVVDQEFWAETKNKLERVLIAWEEELNSNPEYVLTALDLSRLQATLDESFAPYVNETWYQEMVASLRLQDYINSLLAEWAQDVQGKTLTIPTLDELFGNSESIQEIMRLADLAPDVIDAFLSLSVRQDKWNEFWSMQYPLRSLCGNFSSFFELPPESESNITAVEEVVCSADLMAIEGELVEVFNLDEISAQLSLIIANDPSLGPYNWTASSILSMQAQEAIAGLSLDPFRLEVDPVWWERTRTDLLRVLEQYDLQMFPEGNRMQSLQENLQGIRNFLNRTGIFEMLPHNDLRTLKRLVADWELLLSHGQNVFDEAALYLNTSISPEMAARLLSLKPEEIDARVIAEVLRVNYLAYIETWGYWQLVFCNTSQDVSFRLYPLNKTVVDEYLCSVGAEKFFSDLEGSIGYNFLEFYSTLYAQSDARFDWQHLFDLLEETISLVEEFASLPSLGGMDMGELLLHLKEAQVAVLKQDVKTVLSSLERVLGYFAVSGELATAVRKTVMQKDTIQALLGVSNTSISALDVCDASAPLLDFVGYGSTLVTVDLLFQIVDQLYFDLPYYVDDIQAILDDQTAVSEFAVTFMSVSSDLDRSWQSVSSSYQIYLFNALFVDILEGNLHEVACSPEDLASLLQMNSSHISSSLSTLVCSVDTIVQTDLVQRLFTVVDFSVAASKIKLLQTGQLPPLSCSSLFTNAGEFANNVVLLLTDPSAFQLNLELPALAKSLLGLSPLLGTSKNDSLEPLLEVVGQLLDGDLTDLNDSVTLLIEELLRQYEYYVESVEAMEGLVPIRGIWWNMEEVFRILVNRTNLSLGDVVLLMDGFIDTTVFDEFNITYSSWREALCQRETFEEIIVLSSSDLKELVYRETCGSQNWDQLSWDIVNWFDYYKFHREKYMSHGPAPGLMEFVGELVEILQAANTTLIEDYVNEALPLLTGANGLSDMIDAMPESSKTFRLLKSIDELLDQLEPLLSGSPEFQQVQDLVKLLIEKKYLFDVLEDLPELQVIKSLNDPAELGNFLEYNISISEEVVEILLNSTIRLETILPFNVSNTKRSTCQEDTFTDYLTFKEGTDVTAVVNSVCGANATGAFWDIVDTLASQANLEDVADQFSSANLFNALTNMTASLQNISDSVENLSGLEQFPDLLESAGSLDGIFDAETLEELATGEISAFTLLEENPDLLCGGGGAAVNGGRRRRRETDARATKSGDFCTDLYAGVQEGQYGDLRWAYTKPVVLGKILYTPDNEVTRKIIMKANKPFQDMLDIRDLATAWIEGAEVLTEIISSQGFADIQNLLGNAYLSQLLESQLGVDVTSLGSLLNGDLAGVSPEDLRQITALAEAVRNLTGCTELDRFEGFNNLEELEDRANELNLNGQFLAAVQFYGLDDLGDEEAIPKHLRYALRMDTERTPTTRDLHTLYWYPDSRDGYYSQQQYLHGYVFLQDLVERAVVELHADNGADLSSVYVQQMPFPCFQRDRFLSVSTIVFPLLFVVGSLVLIAVMTHQLVYEKERGIEELMKVMGLYGGLNWWAWFIVNFVLYALIMVVASIIFYAGGMLVHSQWSLVYVLLLCFAFSVVMMSYMVSSFFNKSKIAALGSLIVFLMLYLPYGFVFAMGGNISLGGSLGASLASPSAFCFGCIFLVRYEHQGVGALWSNAWDNPRYGDHSSLAAACIMMVVDGFLYFIIGWYVRTVFPGKYGVPRPWYFPLQAKYWKRRSSKVNVSTLKMGEGAVNHGLVVEEGSAAMSTTTASNQGTIECEPADSPIGISIRDLSKVYGARCTSEQNRALDRMSLNAYEGQVTALLGTNGAGKTTAISIMTGMFPSTSGSVHIYNEQVGYGGRRSDVGLCPQHNALYEELTVQEHLLMYGRLQGLDTKAIREHGVTLLEELQLIDMVSVPVRNLSGGMKRKLCVAISLIGDPQTVILDEPTSGVDPHARRAVWDLIIRNKQDRTILLCTHFMDEADLLGDRIAILDHGKLQCCGSSGFLKSKFTSGVKLTLAKDQPSGCSTPDHKRRDITIGSSNIYSKTPKTKETDVTSTSSSQKDPCDSSKVTEFLTSKVNGITLIREVGSELVYQLPSTPGSKVKFSQLFRDLDEQLDQLHIRNYGVSDTKLEEVFLKVSTQSENSRGTDADWTQEVSGGQTWLDGPREEAMYGSSRNTLFQQVKGILIKRFHISRRDWRGLIWAILMPLAFLILGTGLTLVAPPNIHPKLQLTPAMFRDPNYVFFSNGETGSQAGDRLTQALFGAPGIGTTCMADADEPDKYPCSFTEDFFEDPISELTIPEQQSIVAEDARSPSCACEGGRQSCPAGSGGMAPPEWTMDTSAILQDLSLKTDLNEYLLDTRHMYQRERFGGVSFVDVKDGDMNETVVKAWYSNIRYHALPTFINVANNILLRASLPDGAEPSEYGITAYNHPLDVAKDSADLTGWVVASVQFGLVLFLMASLALIPSALSTLVVQENINGARELHFVSGVTPARYWLTNLLWDWLVYLVPAFLIIVVLVIFDRQSLIASGKIGPFILLLLVYGFAIFSQYYLLAPLFADTGTAFVVYFCSNLLLFIVTLMPTFVQYLQLGGPTPGDWLHTLNNIFLIFTPFCLASAITEMLYAGEEAKFYSVFGVSKEVDAFALVGWNIFAMLVHGVVALAVLLVLEYKKKQRVKCGPSPAATKPNYQREDDDVGEERQRVSGGGASEDILVLEDITKVYKLGKRKLRAVDHISFGLPKGECFGLLGVNGAGKTTLFKTITADVAPTSGSIKVNSKSIGYCPQVDAVYDQLTGEEILYCYARLKGISEEHIGKVVNGMVQRMGMLDYVHKVISKYSGGMKRTLSVAVALLGDPQLVLMDEPTAGMDPISKQAVWRSIQATIADGRSVIVTSHGMEECENLCTRLAIMVNGRFRCLGSPQHVKHQHGDGYTVILHLAAKAADIQTISGFMDRTFPNNVLKEHHLTMLRYQLSGTKGLVLADIYEAIEGQRGVLGIEDYSLTQTTLDQVFVNFAKRQKDMAGGDDASSTSSADIAEFSPGISNPAYDPMTVV